MPLMVRILGHLGILRDPTLSRRLERLVNNIVLGKEISLRDTGSRKATNELHWVA